MAGSFDTLTLQQKQLLEQAQALTYKVIGPDDELKVHFYLPKGLMEGERRSVFLFYFSSNWDRGNVIQFAPQALYFVERGAVAGLVEYRTKTSHPESTPIDSTRDVFSSIRFVRQYQDQLNIDPNRVVVVGAGAGANMAGCAALGLDLKDLDDEYGRLSPVPNAAVLLSTLIDVNRKSFAAKQFEDHMGDARKLNLSVLVEHSPPCSVIMIHGTADRLTSIMEAEAFAVRMKKRKKNDFEFHPFEGRDSNFYNLNVDPVSFEAALNQMDRFLVEQGFLGRSDDPNGASLVSWREQDF